MATYEELHELRTDDRLRQQVAVAVMIAAQAKLSGTPTAGEAAWAKSVIGNPGGAGDTVVNLVLAANSGASVASITSATDATVQANVDGIVDGLIAAGA